MSQSRLVILHHLTALWNRIRFDQGIDVLQVNALRVAIDALHTPLDVDWKKKCVYHHRLIEVKEI